ncbi:FG-GAP repeat [Carpediemonas membranifera]|uniref:FG-GAP repeat n=1 Tax=Carpediemonas membranifera TaxID=201153 RepID=A0A8J6B0A1_9EUKA|nr:FG-GAP repeat [Carpediemonas membranifera]|eukprot:KAG9392748.1 FG-GAP repeat [Carpediemonas membranifera]
MAALPRLLPRKCKAMVTRSKMSATRCQRMHLRRRLSTLSDEWLHAALLLIVTLCIMTNNGCIAADWEEQAKLSFSDQGDVRRVAGIGIDGNTLIAGSNIGDNIDTFSGAAFVFVRSGASWQQEAWLNGTDAATSDAFGFSTDVSGDIAIIGAIGDDDNGTDSGTAYVFTRDGTWSQTTKLYGPDTTEGDAFGTEVAIDGNSIIVGAPNNANATGAAYVFTMDGDWAIEGTLRATDANTSDLFGTSVDIDGDTAVVGAVQEGETFAGSAYVFVRTNGVWSQQAKLTADDAAEGDMFGASVAITGDHVLVGAPAASVDSVMSAGAVYYFNRTDSTWSQCAKLVASDNSANDNAYFGTSVAVEGSVAVVGAYWADSMAGAAYTFTMSENGTWIQQARLSAADGDESTMFGASVAVSGGYTAAIQAFGDDSLGAAFVFQGPGSAESGSITHWLPIAIAAAAVGAMAMAATVLGFGGVIATLRWRGKRVSRATKLYTPL